MHRTVGLAIVASVVVSILSTLFITTLMNSSRAIAGSDDPMVIQAQRFVLQDSAGATRAILGLDSAGRPGLTMMNSDGKDRVQLRLETDGHPSFHLLDPDGTRRVAISVNSAGDSIMLLREPGVGSGETQFAPFRTRFVVRNNGATSLGVFDSGARPTTPPIWTAP